MAGEQKIGKVTHYYGNAGAAIIELSEGVLKKGDKIHFKGKTTDFEEVVDSLQWDHKNVEEGKKGSSIAIAVKDRVRLNDEVYKVAA